MADLRLQHFCLAHRSDGVTTPYDGEGAAPVRQRHGASDVDRTTCELVELVDTQRAIPEYSTRAPEQLTGESQ